MLHDAHEDREDDDVELHASIEEIMNELRKEEDYDPKMFEESKERAEPRHNQECGEEPALTITLASLTKFTKPSKMLDEAIEEEGDELDFETIEAGLVSRMSGEVVDKSYAYGVVGVRMQKRLPLRQPYEQMLQDHMKRLRERIEVRLNKYT